MDTIGKLIEIGKLEGIETQITLLKDLIENQLSIIENFKNNNIGIESCCKNYIAMCNAEVIFKIDYAELKERTLQMINESLKD